MENVADQYTYVNTIPIPAQNTAGNCRQEETKTEGIPPGEPTGGTPQRHAGPAVVGRDLSSTKIWITRFRSYKMPQGERKEVTVAQLWRLLSRREECWEKEAAPGWSPALFEEDRRLLKNVTAVYAVVLDQEKRKPLSPDARAKLSKENLDAEDRYQATAQATTPAEAAAYWEAQGVLGASYTSYSHRPASPRHRVTLMASRPMTPLEYPKVWEMVVAHIERAGHLIDKSACDASRFWYMPAQAPGREDEFEFCQWPGKPLDVDALLAEWDTKHPTPLEGPDPSSTPNDEDLATTGSFHFAYPLVPLVEKKVRAKGHLVKCPPCIAGAEGDNHLYKIACDCFRFDLDLVGALELLREFNSRCIPPWPETKLERTIARADERIGNDRGSKLRENPPRPAPQEPPQSPVETTGDPIIDRFNKEYFVGWSGAHQDAFNFYRIVNGTAYVVTKDSIIDATASWPKVPCGEGKFKTAFKHWNEHPQRRAYEAVRFAPRQEVGPNEYNLFNGYAVQARPGSWSRLQDHWLNIICSGDHALYQYFFAWVANMFQRPWDKPGVAIVLFSEAERTGKGTLAHAIGHLLGPGLFVAEADSEALFGRFNANLERSILLNPDEALWGGDKRTRGKIKHALTEPSRQIEHKGGKRYAAPNYSRFLITTNNRDAVFVDRKDGRFVVIEVSEQRANDHSYFATLRAELEEGGYEALLYDLMHYDLDACGVNLRQAYKTQARSAMQRESWAPEDRFWFHILNEGLLPERTTASGDLEFKEHEKVGVAALWKAYKETCDRYAPVLSASQLMDRIKQLCPQLGESKAVRSKAWRPGQEDAEVVKARALPPLTEARKSFVAVMGKVGWNAPHQKEDPNLGEPEDTQPAPNKTAKIYAEAAKEVEQRPTRDAEYYPPKTPDIAQDLAQNTTPQALQCLTEDLKQRAISLVRDRLYKRGEIPRTAWLQTLEGLSEEATGTAF